MRARRLEALDSEGGTSAFMIGVHFRSIPRDLRMVVEGSTGTASSTATAGANVERLVAGFSSACGRIAVSRETKGVTIFGGGAGSSAHILPGLGGIPTLAWAWWHDESRNAFPASMATLKPLRNTDVSPSVAIAPRTLPQNMAAP